jgi:hypothetical protein
MLRKRRLDTPRTSSPDTPSTSSHDTPRTPLRRGFPSTRRFGLLTILTLFVALSAGCGKDDPMSPGTQEPVGALYDLRLDELRLIEDGCDGPLTPSPEVYYQFDLHTAAGTARMLTRSSGSAVTLKQGQTVKLGTLARGLRVLRDGNADIRITGTAWDHDTASADEVIGRWDLTWGYGTTNGQRYFTRSENGCKIRLYVTLTKTQDLYE